MSATSNKFGPNWLVDHSFSYSPNEKENISSRLYAVIGADNSGESFVKFRGFGPEFQYLIEELKKYSKKYNKIGNDIYFYPKDGYALGLMKIAAKKGRRLGFKYGAEVRLRAINLSMDPFSDGTLMGHVEKKDKMRKKIAKILYREGLIASRLIFASTAEQEAEKVLKEVLPDSVFSGKVHAVGGYVRDEMLNKLFPGKTNPPKDLDAVVEMKDGAKKVSHYLHDVLYNSKGESATHKPHLLGRGYPIWSLSFYDDESGNVKIGNKIYATAGAVIEFADTQKEAFPDPQTRQRVTTYGSLDDDIKRRDFTVNMLIKDLSTGEVRDLTGVSKEDLKKGVLRGHPEVDLVKIFSDDPLRMIRLIRFKVKYGWDIPEDVKDIVRNNVYRLNILSSERIRDELIKIIEYGKLREAIELAKELNLDKVESGEEDLNALSFLLKKLEPLEMRHESPHHVDTKDKKDDKIIDHTLNVVDEAKNTVESQLAALLHDIGKPLARAIKEDGRVSFAKHEEKGLEIVEEILRRFKLDSRTIKKVINVVKNHMKPHNLEQASPKAIRKFIRDMGEDLEDVLNMAEADSKGKNPPDDYIYKLRKKIKDIKNAEIPVAQKAVLDGKEIMDILGVKSGPIIGKAKKLILEIQDEKPSLTKDEAEKEIKEAYDAGIIS